MAFQWVSEETAFKPKSERRKRGSWADIGVRRVFGRRNNISNSPEVVKSLEPKGGQCI